MTMNPMNDKLLVEVAIGERHKKTWDEVVEPFFAERQLILFNMFCDVDSTDKDLLQSIKMQQNALKSMRIHFMSFIETGKMAEVSLAEQKLEEENSDDD